MFRKIVTIEIGYYIKDLFSEIELKKYIKKQLQQPFGDLRIAKVLSIKEKK